MDDANRISRLHRRRQSSGMARVLRQRADAAADGEERLRFTIPTTVMSALLIVFIPLTTSAQQVSVLSKQAAEIKRKTDTLSPGSRISVIPIHGAERFGKFISSDSESFTFHDVDDKTDVALKYSEVRKLKQGYGGYNSVSGKHTDRKRGIIVAVVIMGVVLGVLIGALATAKD